MSNIPDGLYYTAEHEWVSEPAVDGTVRVGITDFAQDALGDVVYVQMPEEGTGVTGADVIGEVESTKSVSDIYAPVTGRSSPATRRSTTIPRSSTPTRTARAGCSRSRSRIRPWCRVC